MLIFKDILISNEMANGGCVLAKIFQYDDRSDSDGNVYGNDLDESEIQISFNDAEANDLLVKILVT